MAVAWDVNTGTLEVERTGTTDPQTWTHTPAGTLRAVVVAVIHGTSSTDHVSGVTYGGVALARVVRATDTATETGAAELWFLGSSVPTGAQTVSVDFASATTDDIHCVSMGMTAAVDCAVVDFDSISENAANPSVTLQYGGKTCLAVAALYGGGAAPSSFTPNANCSAVQDFDIAAFYSTVIRQTTPGSSDFAVGGTASSDDVAYVALAVGELQAYTLTADAGSYTLTGTAASLERGYTLTADSGTFALTGTAATLSRTYVLTATAGAFSLTGTAAGLLVGRRLVAESGAFAVTGTAAGLSKGYPLAAESGGFAVTGTDAALTCGRLLSANSGAFGLTGTGAGLHVGHILSADPGAFTLTGQDATLTYDSGGDPVLVAESGAFTVTGTAAGLLVGRRLAADSGSFALTGTAASLTCGRLLTAAFGAYVLTGQDATLSVGSSGAYTLVAESAAFAWAGASALLTYVRAINRTRHSADFPASAWPGIRNRKRGLSD